MWVSLDAGSIDVSHTEHVTLLSCTTMLALTELVRNKPAVVDQFRARSFKPDWIPTRITFRLGLSDSTCVIQSAIHSKRTGQSIWQRWNQSRSIRCMLEEHTDVLTYQWNHPRSGPLLASCSGRKKRAEVYLIFTLALNKPVSFMTQLTLRSWR
ncbi:hypothetical protein SEVIR_2G415966v4 [Setaria viridis]